MPVELLVDAPLSTRLSVRLSPLAELMAALHTAHELGHHPTSRDWVDRFEAAEDGDLLAGGIRWAPLWGGFKARYLLPIAPGPDLDVERELLTLEQLPADMFIAMTAQALVGTNRYFLAKTADLTRQGPSGFMARLRLLSDSHVDLGTWLIRDPSGLQKALVGYLRRVHAGAFGEEWARRRERLEGECARIRDTISTEPLRVFEDMPQATMQPEHGSVIFDVLYSAHLRLSQAPLILMPSVHVNPHMTIKFYPRLPVVIQFPVNAHDSDYVTVGEAQRRLTVLTDATRLAICRHIIRRPASTTELAQALKMTVPQVSRHLRHLREAGVITGNRVGSVVHYQLDLGAVRRIGVDLITALLR